MNKPKFEPPRRVQVATPAAARGRVEGFPMAMVRADQDGISFGIDISKAPVPTREYASEICSVVEKSDEVRFIFGQLALGEEEIDSVLIVRFNPQAAREFSESVSLMKDPSLLEIAKASGVSPIPLVTIETRPRQMAMVIANLAAVAVSGFETCIDFYRASPFSMRDASVSQTLGLEPVVRVDIQSGQFLSFTKQLEEIVAKMPRMPGA